MENRFEEAKAAFKQAVERAYDDDLNLDEMTNIVNEVNLRRDAEACV
jgi:hypothetical protein